MPSRAQLIESSRWLAIGVHIWACSHSSEPPPSPSPGRGAATSMAQTPATSGQASESASRSNVVAPSRTQGSETPTPTAPSAAPSLDPGLANLDPSDDDVVGPPPAIADCEERLLTAGVRFRRAQLPIVKRKGTVCGAPQVVEYLEGPQHIRYRPPPLVTCQLALALAHFEHVVARTADEVFGANVGSLTQGGTYSCRSMARFRLVSEHSYANAIDLYSFGLSGGQTVSVAKHFGRPRDPATSRESRFLRILSQRLFDEDVFSVVVTRFFDELHRDHIHVDMAHYRTDGSR